MGPSDANYGWESKKKVIPIDKKEQRPSFVFSREVVLLSRKEERRTHTRHVFFVRIECIECHECSREWVYGTKWRELWMRIEEKSDSYRQEGTASIIRCVFSWGTRSRVFWRKDAHIHATCFLYELKCSILEVGNSTPTMRKLRI